MKVKPPTQISSTFVPNHRCTLLLGDCREQMRKLPDHSVDLTITSPPYFMGKAYDASTKINDFINLHASLVPEVLRVTKDGGSICWQVGYNVKNGQVIPLDYLIYEIFSQFKDLFLRNRIVWTFGHGLHGTQRFSGRHEIILWFTKGKEYHFDLDSVRVAQKYPGKKYYKGKKRGQYSGHPLGKNPSDVWDIPNVKAQHIEKTEHPCQFPVALAQRLLRALCPAGGMVLDPFMGVGSTGVAALVDERKFVGIEVEKTYYDLAWERCELAIRGEASYRPLDKPVLKPDPKSSVARKPAHFR